MRQLILIASQLRPTPGLSCPGKVVACQALRFQETATPSEQTQRSGGTQSSEVPAIIRLNETHTVAPRCVINCESWAFVVLARCRHSVLGKARAKRLEPMQQSTQEHLTAGLFRSPFGPIASASTSARSARHLRPGDATPIARVSSSEIADGWIFLSTRDSFYD
jgi:hypothetical protein